MPPKGRRKPGIQSKITPAGKRSRLPEVDQRPKRNASKALDTSQWELEDEEVPAKRRGE
jgi:hypothetical protein